MPTSRRILLRWAFCLAAGVVPLVAGAQQLVSIRANVAKLRAAPGKSGELLWQLNRGYPLQVLERQGRWLKVRDFEGDQGWVAASTTGAQPYHVVRVRSARLRAGPGDEHAAVGYAVYGQVLQTEFRGVDWVRVQLEPGRTAWIARDLLWGW